MSLVDLVRSATSRVGLVRVRNALNPILWLTAVSSTLCFTFAYEFNADPILRYGLASLGTLPILVSLTAYLYFMFRDPDRLQSEEFVLRQQELTIIDRKGGPSIPLEAEPMEGSPMVIGPAAPRSKDRLS